MTDAGRKKCENQNANQMLQAAETTRAKSHAIKSQSFLSLAENVARDCSVNYQV